MKGVTQTACGPAGNCFEACIASILETDIYDVPSLEAWQREDTGFIRPLNDWLAERGLQYIEITPQDEKDFWGKTDVFAIQLVRNPVLRSPLAKGPEVYHAVVVKKGEVVWDPFPIAVNWAPLSPAIIGLFIAVDPAKREGK